MSFAKQREVEDTVAYENQRWLRNPTLSMFSERTRNRKCSYPSRRPEKKTREEGVKLEISIDTIIFWDILSWELFPRTSLPNLESNAGLEGKETGALLRIICSSLTVWRTANRCFKMYIFLLYIFYSYKLNIWNELKHHLLKDRSDNRVSSFYNFPYN